MSNKNGFLYSIQSLRKIDKTERNDTGNQLIDYFDSFSFRQKKVFDVTTQKKLIETLTKIKNEVSAHPDEFVFLSLDTHGDDNHLELTNRFDKPIKVKWQDLAPYIIDINVASKMKLVLLSSCCRGASFLKFLKYNKYRAPYYYFFGPEGNAYSNHILDFNESVVEYIYNAGSKISDEVSQYISDFNEQWEKSHSGDTRYIAMSACELFKSIYKNGLDVYLNPINAIMVLIKLQKKRHISKAPLMTEGEMKQFFCDYYSKSENERKFVDSWNTFLMNIPSFNGSTPQQIFDKIWKNNESVKCLAKAQEFGKLFGTTGAIFSKAVQIFKL